MLVDRRVIPGVCRRYSLFKVIVQAEVPPSRKIDLFKGSINKNGEAIFRGWNKKLKLFFPLTKTNSF